MAFSRRRFRRRSSRASRGRSFRSFRRTTGFRRSFAPRRRFLTRSTRVRSRLRPRTAGGYSFRTGHKRVSRSLYDTAGGYSYPVLAGGASYAPRKPINGLNVARYTSYTWNLVTPEAFAAGQPNFYNGDLAAAPAHADNRGHVLLAREYVVGTQCHYPGGLVLALPQGTGSDQRLGDSIFCRQLRLRFDVILCSEVGDTAPPYLNLFVYASRPSGSNAIRLRIGNLPINDVLQSDAVFDWNSPALMSYPAVVQHSLIRRLTISWSGTFSPDQKARRHVTCETVIPIMRTIRYSPDTMPDFNLGIFGVTSNPLNSLAVRGPMVSKFSCTHTMIFDP